MAFKRKHDHDDAQDAQTAPKHLKLVPFPSFTADADVAMSDSSSDGMLTPDIFAARAPHLSTSTVASNFSTSSSDSSSPSAFMSQHPFESDSVPVAPKPVGLIGCAVLGSSFKHHNANCTQLPKLRMACAAGPGRSRTMWSSCEQCGAIAMVDLD